MIYRVCDLYNRHGKMLALAPIGGPLAMHRKITLPEVDRPGLALSGYLVGHEAARILILGNVEERYLEALLLQVRLDRLRSLLTSTTPALIISKDYLAFEQIVAVCNEKKISCFKSELSTGDLINKLTIVLMDEFAPEVSCHGCLVEVFGLGVLIEGESAIGKVRPRSDWWRGGID